MPLLFFNLSLSASFYFHRSGLFNDSGSLIMNMCMFVCPSLVFGGTEPFLFHTEEKRATLKLLKAGGDVTTGSSGHGT